MTDEPTPPVDPPVPPIAGSGGGAFCGECGAALPPGAAFCGSCGASTGIPADAADEPTLPVGPPPTSGEPPAGPLAPPTAPTVGGPPPGTWTGPRPVLEPPGPPVGGPPPTMPVPAAGPPGGSGGGKGKGPLIAVVVLVLIALGVGAFFVFGGGGDDDDDVASRDTTTTTEDEDTTTTTEDEDATTTTTEGEETPTTADGSLDDITFTRITDSTNTITVEVPDDWTDVALDPTSEGQPAISASTDLQALNEGFEVPGLFFTVLAEVPTDFDAAIDSFIQGGPVATECTAAGKQAYDDNVFTGAFEVYGECAGIGTTIIQVVAANADGTAIALGVQIPSDLPVQDLFQHIVETFNTV